MSGNSCCASFYHVARLFGLLDDGYERLDNDEDDKNNAHDDDDASNRANNRRRINGEHDTRPALPKIHCSSRLLFDFCCFCVCSLLLHFFFMCVCNCNLLKQQL